MPKSILEKLEECFPKEYIATQEASDDIVYRDGYNDALQNCIDSLPEVLRVIEGEIRQCYQLHHKVRSAFHKDSYDSGYHKALWDVETNITLLLTTKK